MAQQDGEKTEAPTPKRRQDAREKGDVAQSRDVPTLFILLAAFVFLSSPLGARLGQMVAGLADEFWSGRLLQPTTMGDFHAIWLHLGAIMALALAPLALVLALVGTASHLVQSGLLFSGHPLKPRLEKLSPAKGFQRLVSLDRLFDLAKSLIKLVLIGAVVWSILQPEIPRLLGLVGAPASSSIATAGGLARKLLLIVLSAYALFAMIDVAWVRLRHERKLRMTKTEVRDEHKQREGDPQLRGRIRQIQREMSRHRMIAAVADADVVVTNPTHYAVALQYRPPVVSAPRVVAKGRNHLALRIRREAERHDVPIVENPPVAQLLYKQAPLDKEIPETLYQAVAELLAFVYRLDPRRSSAWRAAS